MKNKCIFYGLLISALILGVWIGGARAPAGAQAANVISTAFDRVSKTHVLRCGYVMYPPYLNRDPNTGKLSGLSYDLTEEMGRLLGVKIEWTEEVGWGTMLEGLNEARYDAVCTAVWQNAARAMQASFSAPYGYAPLYAWAKKGHRPLPSNPALYDTPAIRLAVMDGEMTDTLARMLYPKAATVSLPQMAPYNDLFMNVITGKADMVFAEEGVARNFLKANPGALVKLDPKPLVSFPIVFALPQGDTRLKGIIDAALGEIIASPKYDQILASYGGAKGLGIMKPGRGYSID